MKDQLLLLTELQKVDSRILEIKRKIKSLPEQLAPAKADLGRLQGMLDIERRRLEETETWRKEQEALIKREEEAIRDAKAKLQASKNQRDYSAANREISNKRKSVSDKETEILKVFDKLAESKKSLESNEADVGKLREHVEKEEASLTEEMDALAAEAKSHDAERDAVAAKVDPALLKRYNVTMERKGTALVSVINGACTGCNLKLPPQLANELARFDSLEPCPQCKRLLFRQELLEDTEAAS